MSCKGTKLMPQFKIPTMTRNQVAVPMSPDAELGLAMLIVEDEYGLYEPVAVAGTINEAKELLKAICADGCSGSNEARIGFARLATCFGGVAERVTTALSVGADDALLIVNGPQFRKEAQLALSGLEIALLFVNSG